MRRLSVAAFALWLAGSGCAFCCGPPALDIHAREGATAAHDESAASPDRHCASHPARVSVGAAGAGVSADTTERTFRIRVGASSCCGRACRHPYAASRLTPAKELAFACAPENVSWEGGATPEITRPEARGHSPDGRATHVRCCVFRI